MARFVPAALALALVDATPAAAVRYAAPNGSSSDTNDCTVAASPCSLPRAVALGSHQGVQMAPGAYELNETLVVNGRALWPEEDGTVVVRGPATGSAVVLNGSSFEGSRYAHYESPARIIGGDSSVPALVISGGGGAQNLEVTGDIAVRGPGRTALGAAIKSDGTISFTDAEVISGVSPVHIFGRSIVVERSHLLLDIGILRSPAVTMQIRDHSTFGVDTSIEGNVTIDATSAVYGHTNVRGSVRNGGLVSLFSSAIRDDYVQEPHARMHLLPNAPERRPIPSTPPALTIGGQATFDGVVDIATALRDPNAPTGPFGPGPSWRAVTAGAASGVPLPGNPAEFAVRGESDGLVLFVGPDNVTPPSLRREGERVIITPGTWVGAQPITYERLWERCAGGACTPLEPASGLERTIAADDVGAELRIVEKATNGKASSIVNSPPLVITRAASSPPAPVRVPVSLCGQDITLLDVSRAGRSVRISGITHPKYTGQVVTVLGGTRKVGIATVRPDASFTATVPLPRKAARASIRYSARVGAARSRALKLERLVQILKRSGRRITAKINVARGRRPRTVQLRRQLTCAQTQKFKIVKVKRDGTFTVRLDRAAPPEPFALYRVIVRLSRGTSYTLPIAVR